MRVVRDVSEAPEHQLPDDHLIVLLHDRTRGGKASQTLDHLVDPTDEVLDTRRLALRCEPGPMAAGVSNEAFVEADPSPPHPQRDRAPARARARRTTAPRPDARSSSDDSRAVPSGMVWAIAHERARCHSWARESLSWSSSSSRCATASARKPVASGSPVRLAYRSSRARISGLTGTLSGTFLRSLERAVALTTVALPVAESHTAHYLRASVAGGRTTTQGPAAVTVGLGSGTPPATLDRVP